MSEQTTLSGRELARARRAGMAQAGKSGIKPSQSGVFKTAVHKTVPAVVAKPAAISSPLVPSEQTATSGRDLARARRAMMAQSGKRGIKTPQSGSPRRVHVRESVQPIEAIPSKDNAEATDIKHLTSAELDVLCDNVEHNSNSMVLGANADNVRQICRNRRRALSAQGKSAIPGKFNPRFKADNCDAGRLIARQHRAELSQNGRGNAAPSRPNRVRPKPTPVKVETGTTLSGRTVTGTQVERNSRVTGNEPGSCRSITGTEYIGAEQFETFCETRPEPSIAKVGISMTSQGHQVSGTDVGRSVKVTGDEAGGCKAITGTEYLGSEQFAEFCQNRGLFERAEKVVVGSTLLKGIPVSGSDEARVRRVTGAESGATRSITGSQYADAGVSRLTINGPTKVALTHTIAGRPVTGTELGRTVKITGEEAGSCRIISGTEYLSNEQFQSICNTTVEPSPAKVGLDISRNGQRITGNLVDRTEKVTGNEPGTCQRVTGAQYGSTLLCGDTEQSLDLTSFLNKKPNTAGNRYGSVMLRQSPRYLAPADQPLPQAPSPIRHEPPRPVEFSITTPARYAQDLRERITGNAYSGGTHITGPANMAAGLVSGTPEFRYGDEGSRVQRTPTPAEPAEEVQQSYRITGEGRDIGTRITGDDWSRSGRVTGTEGRWAQGRNQSLRGESRNMGTAARDNKDRERPEASTAKITGTSGNSAKGTMITVSGGARG